MGFVQVDFKRAEGNSGWQAQHPKVLPAGEDDPLRQRAARMFAGEICGGGIVVAWADLGDAGDAVAGEPGADIGKGWQASTQRVAEVSIVIEQAAGILASFAFQGVGRRSGGEQKVQTG